MDEISERVYKIIDEMYHIFKSEDESPEVREVLLKAGKALDKNMPAQIVAAKTVNGITIVVLTNNFHLNKEDDKRVSELINELKNISRAKGYKWMSTGIGDLRIQFE